MILSYFIHRSHRYVALLSVVIGLSLLPNNLFAATKVEEVTSAYGIESWLIEERNVPMAVMQLIFKNAGYAYDPPGKEGLAAAVSELLLRGNKEQDMLSFRTFLDENAIQVQVQTNSNHLVITIRALKDALPVALKILAANIHQPRLLDTELTFIREQLLTKQSALTEDNEHYASQQWKYYFFQDHPMSRPNYGTAQSVSAITLQDIKEFYSQRLTRLNLLFNAVGDITPSQLANLLDAGLNHLPLSTDAVVAELPSFKRTSSQTPNKPIIYLEHRPIKQAVMIFGTTGPTRKDTNFYPSFVMNHVLGGGGFESRFMHVLRSQHGLTYGVHSYLQPTAPAAYWAGEISTQSDRIHQSLRLITEQIDRIRNEPVTQHELDDVKRYLHRSFPIRLDTNRALSELLSIMQTEQLGTDFIDKRNGYIQEVSSQAMQEAAKILFETNQLVVYILGDTAQIDQHNLSQQGELILVGKKNP
jgi:zinc protease